MKSKISTMNISLPAPLREQLEEKVSRQGYGSTSEYIRDLIRKDLQRQAIAQVDALLLEGMNSGPAAPMTERDWQELRRIAGRTRRRHHAPKKTRPTSRRTA